MKKRMKHGGALYNPKMAYLFISPFYILFLCFGLAPIIFSCVLAVSKWDGIGAVSFIGFENFKRLFGDANVWRAFSNTLWIFILSTVPQLVLSLIIAFIVNLKLLKAKSFYKISFFVPYIASVVAVVLIFTTLFGTDFGLINNLLKAVGLKPLNWLSDPWLVRIVISFMIMWRGIGYNMVIYLTGLQKIPEDLYEAATVDGASYFQIFKSITVPLMKPIIMFTLIMSTIGGLQVFTEPQLLLGDGSTPEDGGMTIAFYLYNQAFLNKDFGYAAAISWSLALLIIFVSALNSVAARSREGRKD